MIKVDVQERLRNHYYYSINSAYSFINSLHLDNKVWSLPDDDGLYLTTRNKYFILNHYQFLYD